MSQTRMNCLSTDLYRMIDSLYETVLTPDAWKAALRQLTELFDGRAAHFMLWDQPTNGALFSMMWGDATDQAMRDYAKHYGGLDCRREVVERLPVGQWLLCHEHFDERFVRRNEFYNDFLLPYEVRYMAGARLLDAGGVQGLIGVFRAPGQSPFAGEDIAVLEVLQGHLCRAARLNHQAARLGLQGAGCAAVLDKLDVPILVVSASGRVMFANGAAEALLAKGETLKVRDGRLVAARHADTQRLDAVMAETLMHRRAGTLRLRSSSCPAPHEVAVLPLPAHEPIAGLWQAPLALITVSAPGQSRSLSPGALGAWFGLTAAESRLAQALLDGHTPAEFCVQARVSLATVRSQLRSLFAKTQTRRQAELVRLLRLLPPHPAVPRSQAGRDLVER